MTHSASQSGAATVDGQRSLHRQLVIRILEGPGHAPAQLRREAFENTDVPEALRPLLEKVAAAPARVADADFAAATAAGYTDDQLFELGDLRGRRSGHAAVRGRLDRLGAGYGRHRNRVVRPSILEHGYGLGPRLLFRLIRLMSGHPAPDAARITFYRPDFYGSHMKTFTQEAMRGSSQWSVGDRELMAAYVSQLNECPFCVGAHTATAARACQDDARVAAVLADPETAPIEEGLRATLRMLAKLTREGAASADDMRGVLAAGVSPRQIEDALAVGFAFNTTDRLANAFSFQVLSQDGFEAGAKYLLKRGYR